MGNDIKELLDQVAEEVANNTAFTTKEVLTSVEAAKYMGISLSYLYKLTRGLNIPHFKPLGKMCYYNRLELEKWLQNNKVETGTGVNQREYNFKH